MYLALFAAALAAVAAFLAGPLATKSSADPSVPLGSGNFFDGVAPSYDLLNRVISLGLDQSWRREASKAAAGPDVASRATVHTLLSAVASTGKTANIARENEVVSGEEEPRVVLSISGMDCQGCVSQVEAALSRVDGVTSVDVTLEPPRAVVERKIVTGTVLDVAAGTGDLACILRDEGAFDKVVALDPSEQMLSRLRLKAGKSIDAVLGVAEELPYDDFSFNALTVAFGVRNFRDREKGLLEMFRVLKMNGRLVVLEASVPRGNGLFHKAARQFIRSVMPVVGALVSGRFADYKYLSRSMNAFPGPPKFIAMLEHAGFKVESHRRLWPFETGPDMYVAVKKSEAPH